MNNIVITLIALTAILIGSYFFVISDQKDIHESPEPAQVIVVSTEVKEATGNSNEGGVYATLSDGETRFIAKSSNPETIENYFEIITYRQAAISPNNQFIAVQGSQFEDAIVQVYEVHTDTLHEILYGVFSEWTADGLLKIESCNLAGENCVDKISVSAETPWMLKEVSSDGGRETTDDI